jgi:NADH dehydrogenase FAD-containing subunit
MAEMRVVVGGAGVAGLETALALRALANGLVSVQLVSPEIEFTYRPLAVAEPFRVGEMRHFPLERLVRPPVRRSARRRGPGRPTEGHLEGGRLGTTLSCLRSARPQP